MSASMNVLPRPSLLDRRAANHNPDIPDHLSVSTFLPHTPQSPPHPPAGACLRVSSRRTPASFLPFVPLPPIMASPALTPEVAHASASTAVLETAARKIVQGHASSDSDYVSHHPFPPNPTWTTCPPTPPPKNPSFLRHAPSTPSTPTRTERRRSRSGSRTPPPYRTVPRAVSLASFVPSSQLPPSTTLPSLSTLDVTFSARAQARRMSLPAHLSLDATLKDFPLPPLQCGSMLMDTDMDEPLLPSLSRRAPTNHGSHSHGILTGSSAYEEGPFRSGGKKLFDLDADEGDVSDEEQAEQIAYKEEKSPAQEQRDRDRETEANMDRALVKGLEKEKAERLRRYHALMELLTTEVGYLFDLRNLVTVYLEQLLLLSTPPVTPVPTAPSSSTALSPPSLTIPSPSRTMSTFSALSIPSLFPSSRSSFLQASPLPSPSASASDCLSNVASDCSFPQERERHASYPSASPDSTTREREKENSNRTLTLKSSKSRSFAPVLTEREVRIVCRNAQELLKYHERFVCELRGAVCDLGFDGAFVQSGEDSPERETTGQPEVEEVERAVEIVAAKFANEATFFGIYETFCPGHAAATDLVRRAQERSPAIWDAYEQRCALLLSAPPPDALQAETNDDAEVEISSPVSLQSDTDEALRTDQVAAAASKRRHSTPIAFPTSVSSGTPDSAARGQFPFPAFGPSSAVSPLPFEKRLRGPLQKLKFSDYLIKPVQRICKYPLLLDQLQDKRRKHEAEDDTTPTDSAGGHIIGDIVSRAGEAMRDVVSRVNNASEKEAHSLRSALIASRISITHVSPQAAPSSSSASPSTPPSSEGTASSHGHSNSISSSGISSAPTSPSSPGAPAPIPTAAPAPRAAFLTSEFVSSLGPCLLAGALDIVQHPAQRAKYLGAFLYAGGYCILAKIPKGGRVYEPRHWFALSEVEVVDIEEENASFPYAFRISGYGHHLQLAVSCPQEKAIWIATMSEALLATPSWTNEPLSSLQADEKVPTTPSAPVVEDPSPQEAGSMLPTILSMSELEKQSGSSHDVSASTPSFGRLKHSKTLFRLDGTASKQEHYSQAATFSAALSRRSSTASVKAFFSPITFESARIARPSSQVRTQVEQGLHDVFSESCLAARAQAQMRGEELFQVRLPGVAGGRRQGSVPRSNSAISIASAMGFTAARRKYDSVLVGRRKSSMDFELTAPPVPPLPSNMNAANSAMETGVMTNPEAGGFTLRPKTLAVRRRKKSLASIAPAISTAIAQMNTEEAQSNAVLVNSPEALSLDSPPDASRCSSMSSVLPSPVDISPLPLPVPGISPKGTVRSSGASQRRGRDTGPKRQRSMVYNVRSFFHVPRSDSPSASSSSDPGHSSPTPPLAVDTPSTDYPNAIVQWLRRTSIRGRDSASSSVISGGEDNTSPNRLRPIPRTSTSDNTAMRPGSDFLDVTPSQSPRQSGVSSPKRHQSLFVSSSRSRSTGRRLRDDRGHREEDDASPSQQQPTSTLSTRRSLRNLLLFQRPTTMSPVDPTVS